MPRNEKLIAWVTLFSLMIIWGSSFILIKKGLLFYSYGQVGAIRIIMAWLFLLPWAVRRLRGLSTRQWFFLAIVGLVGSAAPAYLFPKAQTGIDSSLAGILNSLTPLFTLLISVIAFSARPRWWNILGVLIGLAGAVGLMSVSGGHNLQFNFSFAIYILIASMCYAINANLVKHVLGNVKPVTITALAFFIIGPPAVIWLFLATDFSQTLTLHRESWEGLIYLVLLGVIGTGLALMFFNRLIQMTTPVFASSVTYLIPIIALAWGILDGEIFKVVYFLWILLILAGVALVNRKISPLKKTSLNKVKKIPNTLGN